MSNRRKTKAEASNPTPTPAVEQVPSVPPMAPVELAQATAPRIHPEPPPVPAVQMDVPQMPAARPVQADDNTKALAKKIISDRFAKRAKSKLEAAEEDLSTHQYYVRCHVCSGHGIYTTRKPQGRPLRWTEWFSSYKGLTEAWYHPHVLCQECYELGEETHLRMSTHEAGNGELAFGLTHNHARRFVGRILKDQELTVEVQS